MTRPCRCALPAVLLVLLSACGAGNDEVAAPAQHVSAVVRPVKTFVVDTGGAPSQRQFPGRIEAARRADLSFRVPGTVKDILVKEGDTVGEGTVLARLDATDFRIALSDRQASYDNARRNYERARELLPSGNISRLDYDRTETSFKSAEAALRQSRQDLAYTELRAPFAGTVAKRLVQRFEEVAAKEAVLSLQQVNSLDVKIDLSETLLRSFTVPEERAIDYAEAEAPAWGHLRGDGAKALPAGYQGGRHQGRPEDPDLRDHLHHAQSARRRDPARHDDHGDRGFPPPRARVGRHLDPGHRGARRRGAPSRGLGARRRHDDRVAPRGARGRDAAGAHPGSRGPRG
ncbi:MAG: efflux RND transporter periplasmic adaptor subunit [Gammaproteobacteria bacterium]|nr:efflux RND transporter periplasmic adaptor subunit [Gammaproteobacteria bacterium]